MQSKGKGWRKEKPFLGEYQLDLMLFEIIKGRWEETLGVIEEWKGFSMSADFPGPKLGFWVEEEKLKAGLGMQ